MCSGELLFRPGSLPRLSVLWPISDGGPWAREGRSLAHVGRPGPLGLRGEREGSRVPSGLGRSGLVRSGLDRSEPVRVWRALNGPVGPRAGRGPQQSIPFLALGWPIPLLWGTVSPERLEGERISCKCAALHGAEMSREVAVRARL